MKPALSYECLHNPFHNRFNVPVTSRLDEMQSYAYEVLFRERNQGRCRTHTNSTLSASSLIGVKQPASGFNQTASGSDVLDITHWGRLMASGIALLLFLLASAAMLKAF